MDAYNQIVTTLVDSLKNKEGSEVKKAIINFVQQIKKLLVGKLDQNTLNDFVYDNDGLFEKNSEDFSKNPPTLVSVNGLLNDACSVCGVSNYRKLIADIKNDIFNLHAYLSIGMIDNAIIRTHTTRINNLLYNLVEQLH